MNFSMNIGDRKIDIKYEDNCCIIETTEKDMVNGDTGYLAALEWFRLYPEGEVIMDLETSIYSIKKDGLKFKISKEGGSFVMCKTLIECLELIIVGSNTKYTIKYLPMQDKEEVKVVDTTAVDTRKEIYQAITEERDRQDKMWGEDNDDKNTYNDWASFIGAYATEAAGILNRETSPAAFEKGMVQVAALAVAAIESSRRNTQRKAEELDKEIKEAAREACKGYVGDTAEPDLDKVNDNGHLITEESLKKILEDIDKVYDKWVKV